MSNFPEMECKTMEQAIELPENGTSLDLLQRVYRNPSLPLLTRIRAATSAKIWGRWDWTPLSLAKTVPRDGVSGAASGLSKCGKKWSRHDFGGCRCCIGKLLSRPRRRRPGSMWLGDR